MHVNGIHIALTALINKQDQFFHRPERYTCLSTIWFCNSDLTRPSNATRPAMFEETRSTCTRE
jgi:hypothetical protein